MNIKESNKRILAVEISDKLRNAGFKAYFAGGCVRDEIMGVTPEDYDIATDAAPDDIMQLFKKTIPVGVQYGVVIVLNNGIPFEVTTFRKDGIYVDGRHPEKINFSSLPEEDVQRRDFTINGILYDPFMDKILDYVGGQEDIKKGIVRAIGNPMKRFAEDKLRLMRAIRFAGRYGYEIEKNTLEAIRDMADKITEVSSERIRDELDKIIRGRNSGLGLQMLMDTGLLKNILPEVSDMAGVLQPEEFHPEGDVFVHTKMMLDLLDKPSKVLAFAALLHDIGKPKTFQMKERIRFDGHVPVGARIADGILRRLKFSNDEREKIVRCIENHLKFMDVQKMRESKLKRFMQMDTFIDELELHRVDCLASHGKLDNWEFCKKKLEEFSKEEIKPEPIINGNDLIAMGFKPGLIFKEILERVTDLQLENTVKTKEDALTWVKENYRI